MPRSTEALPLTEFQKEFIWGKKEASDPTNTWYEVRRRLRHTVMNGQDIWMNVPKHHREQIFYTMSKYPETDFDEAIDTRRLYDGVLGWLAFLYTGIEDADHAHTVGPADVELVNGEWVQRPEFYFDFGTMLEEAIEEVAKSQGERVTEFELTIETKPIERGVASIEDPEQFQEDVRDGDPLDRSNVLKALQAGFITQEEFWSWTEAQAGKRSGGRRGYSGPTDVVDDSDSSEE